MNDTLCLIYIKILTVNVFITQINGGFNNMIAATKEKVFDIMFDSLKDKIEFAKEKKELRRFTQNYFNEYFENIDFNEEFDFVLVTEYLMNNYERIYNSTNPQDTIDAIISGCIARGKGNEYQINKYCYTFLSFWESIIQRNIPRENWYLMYELKKHFNEEVKELYDKIQNLLLVPKGNIYTANNLYADSFCETLFLHKDKVNSKVKLSNLFVVQKYVELTTEGISVPKNDLINRIEQFIYDDNKQLLLIEGDAGSGKSSLVAYLNYSSKNNNQKLFKNRSLVTIRLRDLDRNMISENNSLSVAMLNYLNIYSFDDFDTLFPDAILLLDGFDELCMIDNIINYERLIYDLWHRLSKSTKLIITSRPKYIFLHQLDITKSNLFLCHFDNEKRIEWINKFISKDGCNETIDNNIIQYIERIDDSEAIGICDTPMSLYMLVSKKIDETALDNIWVLYHQIFYNELSETEYNKMFPNAKRDYSHRISKYRDILYQITEEIAYSMYRSNNNRFYITSQELEVIVEKVLGNNGAYDKQIIRQISEKCYALCNYWKINSERGVVEFYHNNIRDFFLCEKIYRECNLLYDYYKTDEKVLSQKIRELFKNVFGFGRFDTMVCNFLYLRAIYDEKTNKHEFPYDEINSPCLPNVFGFLLSDLSSMVFHGSNPIQLIINVLSTIAQVYRHIYEPYLADNDRIIWWNDVKRINDNDLVKYVFHSVFSQAPVTMEFDKALTMASRSDFKGVILDHCDLKNIGFQNSDLTDAVFSDATLNGCDFTNSILINTDFSNANLDYSCLKNAVLTTSKFTGTQLQGTELPDGQCSTDQSTQIEMLRKMNIKGLII